MATTYELISSTVLPSNTSSITFSSIPQIYTDLILYISARSSDPAIYDQIDARINGNSSAI
jgi:hypothetical protein